MLNLSVKLADSEFVELKDIIYNNSGILFSEQKKYLIENRLARRLSELNFTSFKDYIFYLKYDVRKRSELDKLVNLVTINETYFLRERGQIDYLVSIIIPELLKQGKRKITIWSIPCSTGEEPYSIAILLSDAGVYNKMAVDIIATDINTDVVDIAKRGEYRFSSFRGCPNDFISKNFSNNDNIYTVNEVIKKRVKFNTGNITVQSSFFNLGKVDVVFCRNLLIYFDIDGKKKAVNNFMNNLNPNGFLFLGHSETLSKISDDFTMKNFGTGIVYIKKS